LGHQETKSLPSLNHRKRYHNGPKSLHFQSSSLFSNAKNQLFFKSNRGVMFLSEWSHPQVLSIEGKDENWVHISIHSIGNHSLKIPHIAKWTLKRNCGNFSSMLEHVMRPRWKLIESLYLVWSMLEHVMSPRWKLIENLYLVWSMLELVMRPRWKLTENLYLVSSMLEHVMRPRWKLIASLYLVFIYAWACDGNLAYNFGSPWRQNP
jgi:hypothetical protein